jgi:hypothetical protein
VSSQIRYNILIVISDGINVIDGYVFWDLNVIIRFVTREKTPTAIAVVAWFLTIHVADRKALNSNPVGCHTMPPLRESTS